MDINPELQKSVADILNMALTSLESGANFLKGELPQVVNQLLMWKMVSSILLFLVAVIIFSLMIYWNIRQAKWWMKIPDGKTKPRISEDIGIIAMFNLAQLLVIYEVGPWIGQIEVALKILIAPKVYLLEYGAGLLK